MKKLMALVYVQMRPSLSVREIHKSSYESPTACADRGFKSGRFVFFDADSHIRSTRVKNEEQPVGASL